MKTVVIRKWRKRTVVFLFSALSAHDSVNSKGPRGAVVKFPLQQCCLHGLFGFLPSYGLKFHFILDCRTIPLRSFQRDFRRLQTKISKAITFRNAFMEISFSEQLLIWEMTISRRLQYKNNKVPSLSRSPHNFRALLFAHPIFLIFSHLFGHCCQFHAFKNLLIFRLVMQTGGRCR